jgi:hypothetical protein
VSIQPGKPLAIGFIDGKPVLGVPGYPVSAIVVFEEFVKPLIALLLGERCSGRRTVSARTRRKIPGKLGVEEFVRVRLAWIRGEFVASPMKRGAGQISSIAHADGILRIPARKEGVAENETVEVELLRDDERIRSSVVGFGGYDPILTVIADLLRERTGGTRLAFTVTGGDAALIAVGRGECHFAACHVPEPASDDEIIAYVKRYVGDTAVAIVRIATREPANSQKLESVPAPRDQYLLVIAQDLLESDGVRDLLEIIRSAEFKDVGSGLPQYDVTQAGETVIQSGGGTQKNI